MYRTIQEKKDILAKYSGKTSDDLMIYLRRNFTVTEYKYEWMSEPTKFIKVDDKTRPLKQNKKYLVNVISNLLENDWGSLGTPLIRRTVKKYLDLVS